LFAASHADSGIDGATEPCSETVDGAPLPMAYGMDDGAEPLPRPA